MGSTHQHHSLLPAAVTAALVAAALLAAPATAAAARVAAGAAFSAIPATVRPTNDVDAGAFTSSRMSVQVVLTPRNAAQLDGLLASVYDPSSPRFHNWLAKGEFNARFAPSSAQIAAVSSYLHAAGLALQPSSSPFVVRASGSSAAVSAALRTNLRVYRTAKGTTYFSNASAVQVPAALATNVLGIVGLSNTVRAHPHLKLQRNRGAAAAHRNTGCQPEPYPTRAQLFAAIISNAPFPFGYGGGPGCNGLTPAQSNAIYGAPNVGARGKGAGVNLAVFELSAYKQSDVGIWARTFYGAAYRPRLVDIIVDGGPLSPICPTGDTCPPEFNGYSGDIEVTLDIEEQLAVAPAASHILVYNAPNDFTGQTGLDEFAQIANDDLADVVSSSWGVCENDAGASLVEAENLIFEQMALQGQSVFSAAGDNGAFDCLTLDGSTVAKGTTMLNVDDPPSQPWVTSVGGTSLESYNPGANPHAVYPTGVETVWNPDQLCNTSSNEGGFSGLFWCGVYGAGGGGNSQFWGRPFYQSGPGVINPRTAYGNGTTRCSFAPVGMACRQVPDISANADQITPNVFYCTGDDRQPFSTCATIVDVPNGWLGVGGTSVSSPFLSALIADRDSYGGTRTGNANGLFYMLYGLNAGGFFHDITGIGQSTTTNGYFPTTPGYDLATGVGTPKMSAIITGVPQK